MGGTLVSTGVCIIEFRHFHFFHWQCLFRCFFIISNIFFFQAGLVADSTGLLFQIQYLLEGRG